MTLDEFLNRQKIETLQRLDLFWTDAIQSTSSKSALISRLRRSMLSQTALLSRFQALPASERRLLEILLTASGDILAGLRSRASSGQSSEPSGDILGLFRELAAKGFIDHRSDAEWDTDAVREWIAEEMADGLRRLLGGGIRNPERLLSLRSFVGSLPAEHLTERLTALELPPERTTEPERLVEGLLSPESIGARLDRLEPVELREAVELAITEHFGLLPVERIRARWPRTDETMLRHWQAQLERCLIGTMGTLSLEHIGLNLRGNYLIAFLELAAARLAGLSTPKTERLRLVSNGIAVLLDFVCVLNRIQREELRLTRMGALRKYGADETLGLLLMVTEGDGEEAMTYLESLVSLLTDMGLVQRQEDGTLTPTVLAIQWLKQPVAKQVQDLIRPALAQDWGAGDSSHGHHLRRNFARWCQNLHPGRWYSVDAAASLAVARYLLQVVRGDLDMGGAAFSFVHADPVSLEHLAQDFLEWIAASPLRMGVLDMAFDGQTPALVRTTQVAAHLFSVPWPAEATPSGGLIANPDYEIVLFPGETPPEVHYAVHRMARLSKIDQVFHYRIDEESVSAAAALGLSAEEMVRGLDEHCRGPLPQNIRYSIETWAGRVFNVSVEGAYILELPSPELIQTVRRLPEIAPLVMRELSPTVLALREPPTDRGAIRSLQKLGIYVRR